MSAATAVFTIGAVRKECERSEQRVADRTLELAAKNRELEQAMKARDVFMANMSHELRTPLNAILGFAGTLLMKLPGELNATQVEQLAAIQGSGRHLLSLINDLLDLARIDAGKVEFTPEPLCAREMIEGTLAGLRPLVAGKPVTLSARVPPHDLCLTADRRALRQILINLCSNAIKYTDQGSIAVAAREFDAGGTRCVEFSVTDTGIGISPEFQDKLFQAFAQMDSTQREGTGLGLHLSQKLARQLGGEIRFESRAGEGSRFWLILPAEEKTPVAPDRAVTPW